MLFLGMAGVELHVTEHFAPLFNSEHRYVLYSTVVQRGIGVQEFGRGTFSGCTEPREPRIFVRAPSLKPASKRNGDVFSLLSSLLPIRLSVIVLTSSPECVTAERRVPLSARLARIVSPSEYYRRYSSISAQVSR